MSTRAPMPSRDATSMKSSESHKSRWMSHLINDSSKQGSLIDNSSLICYGGENSDPKGYFKETKGIYFKETKGICNFPFPSLSLGGKNTEKVSTIGTINDHFLDEKPVSLALALCNGGPSKSKDIIGSKSNGSKPVVVFERHFSNDNFTCFSQEGCKYQKSSSVLFHEKKMHNDLCNGSPEKKNFESFFLKKQSRDAPCSIRNVETMRICTMVDSVENSPGDPPRVSQRAHHILFTKETCVNMSKTHQDDNIFDGSFNVSQGFAPRSRGVKIQPLWTSTDSEEKETNGNNPSICKGSSINEESKESDGTQAELSLGHGNGKKLGGGFRLYSNVASCSKGVNIQPLGAFTGSEEKEKSGNIFTCKGGSRNEVSAESDGIRVEASEKRHILSGMGSSPLTKYDTMHDNNPPTACDSSTDKAQSKRPINEIPDINEDLQGLQPAVSSTGGKEPSTSRVHSLNAKQLFSSNEQTSRPKTEVNTDHTFGQDAGSRWIKRLKLNSCDSFGVSTKTSDVGEEDSSHDKFGMFFGRMMKEKHHEKEHMAIDQNVGPVKSVGPAFSGSKKRNRSTMLGGCSWIQRWCQSCRDSPPSNPEPLVICEPHSLKNGQEEITKKQFPSIGAMALMGKAMNGFPSCEFKKRGPVIVWNTKEY